MTSKESQNIELFTVEEVAEILRLSPNTIYQKIEAGEIPAVRIGRTIRVLRGEINRLLESRDK